MGTGTGVGLSTKGPLPNHRMKLSGPRPSGFSKRARPDGARLGLATLAAAPQLMRER
jgi:hypothetical protein